MVEGGSSPLKESSVVIGCCSGTPNPELNEKESEGEPETESVEHERNRCDREVCCHEDGDKNGGQCGFSNRKWVILMEPFDVNSITCTLGAKGRIFRVDDSLATLLGYVSMSELLGTEIAKLIPAVNLDADDEEQHVCALGVRGNSIPITVTIATERDPTTKHALMYELNIHALSALNGVLTLTESGTIHSFNENFIEALVGRKRKDLALRSHIHITDIIPQFHSLIHHCCEASSAGVDDSSKEDSDNGTDKRFLCPTSGCQSKPYEACSQKPGSSTNMPQAFSSSYSMNELTDRFEQVSFRDTDRQHALKIQRPISFSNFQSSFCSKQPSTSPCNGYHVRTKKRTNDFLENGVSEQLSPCREIHEGTFYGLARHSDANMIAIRFDVRRIKAACAEANWAVSIDYDRSADFGLFGSSTAESRKDEMLREDFQNYYEDDDEFPRNEIKIRRNESNALTCVSLGALEDENAESVRGEYSHNYDTFQVIGNGAFGSVKLAARKDSGLLAVTKFICKSKVLPEGWVPSPGRGNRMVPIEVHLLEALSHPNIVKVLDVYENDTYYQLVMEKLGCGMDLFEFIDRRPKMDEALMSYIFRQIVSAVAYLHSNNIVHRDVKDENVIIDQNFCCKLIDFGSAAYFGPDIIFSTFCGTMEYCSPEVLTGNKYHGPEVEMWSLGVLLYTLVFSENPFRSTHETVLAEVDFPWNVSDGLYQVIVWLLQRDPRFRATVDDITNHWWINQSVDIRRYKFQDVLKTYDLAQIDPPLYISELASHLKNVSSCSPLVIDIPNTRQEINTLTAR